MLRRVLPLVASLVLLPACNCGEKKDADGAAASETPAAEGTVPRDDSLMAAVASLGREGVAVVVVRPQHWAALHGALSGWMAKLPPEAEPLRQASTAEALPGLLALALGRKLEGVTLDGWDPSRPVVASLGEVPYDGPPGSVTPRLPAPAQWGVPVRHQVLVPATDPAALVASMAQALEQRKVKALPELVEGRAGARAFEADLVVALLPGEGSVRIVIFQGAMGRESAQRLEHMRSRLDVKSETPPATPALSLLGQPDAVMAAWIRPWRMRPLAAWSGSVEVLRALAVVANDQRAMLMSRGMQIVLSSELLMTDDGAEIDDLATALVVDEGVLRLRTAMSLTPEGEAIFDAATDGRAEAFTVADDAWASLTMRANVGAMLAEAKPPPFFDEVRDLGDIAEAVQEGGYFATLYMGTRHSLGLLGLLEETAKQERLPLPIETLPTGAQLVWRGMDDDGPKVALAVHWPEDYTDRPLAAMVPQAKSDPDFASLRLDTTNFEGRPVTVFGLGGEGLSSFDSKTKAEGDALVRARISPSRIAAWADVPAPVEELLKGTGDAVLTWEHRGKALVAELAWSPSGGEVKAKSVPVERGGSWDSPMGSSTGEGAKCLAKAGFSIAQGLRALSTVSGDMMSEVIARGLSEAEPSLACAAEDEVTADSAGALRAMAVTLGAEALFAGHQYDAATRLLKEQCERSKEPLICARHEAEGKLPHPKLATVELSSSCEPAYGMPAGDVWVRVTASSIAIGRAVVAEADFARTLKAELKDAESGDTMRFEMPAEEGADPGVEPRPSVQLTIDEGVTMARLRPLLQALVDETVTDLVITLGRSGRPATAIKVRLMSEPAIPGSGSAATPAPTVPPEEMGGLYGMRGPSEVVPLAELMAGTEAGRGDWAMVEVGKGKVTSSSALSPEPQVHVAPGATTLRDATGMAFSIYVHGTDDATWKDVASALGALCERVTLVLKPKAP